MATHSNILAGRILWTEEPVGYSPWGRKESDKTELRTLSFLLQVTHKPRFHMAKTEEDKSERDFYPTWLVFVWCIFSLWYAYILQLFLYFCTR